MIGLGHGGPVKVAPLHGLLDVAVELLAMAHEEPVLHPVGGAARGQALLPAGGGQLAQHIPVGAHLIGVPVGDVAAVHLEAVVMLGHGNHILRAGTAEQVGPGGGIELFRLEHGNEVLVAELLLRAVGLDVMLELLRALDVHVAGIPLAAEGGHAVHTPVDENAELQLLVPVGGLVAGQGGPGGVGGAPGDDLIDGLQVVLHGNISFCYGGCRHGLIDSFHSTPKRKHLHSRKIF